MSTQRKPTRKQELVSAISERGGHLPLSKNTINALARYAVNVDDQRVTELLQLISQPDPHKSLHHALPPRIRDVHADWEDATEEDFAEWVANAVLCYHQLDEYLNLHSNYHKMNPEDDRLTGRFVQGMQHYREANPSYTDEQLIDLAMIAAATHAASFNEFQRGRGNSQPDIISGYVCSHTWCHHVTNAKVRNLATSDHVTAMRIIEIITDDAIASEAHILYRLENGPRALSGGVI